MDFFLTRIDALRGLLNPEVRDVFDFLVPYLLNQNIHASVPANSRVLIHL